MICAERLAEKTASDWYGDYIIVQWVMEDGDGSDLNRASQETWSRGSPWKLREVWGGYTKRKSNCTLSFLFPSPNSTIIGFRQSLILSRNIYGDKISTQEETYLKILIFSIISIRRLRLQRVVYILKILHIKIKQHIVLYKIIYNKEKSHLI
jgi:hypothetical protein